MSNNIIEVDISSDSDNEETTQVYEKKLPIDVEKIKAENNDKKKGRSLTQEQIEKRNASLAKARDVKKQMLESKSRIKGRKLTKDEREAENRRSLERIETMLEKLLPAKEVKQAMVEARETPDKLDLEKEIEKVLSKKKPVLSIKNESVVKEPEKKEQKEKEKKELNTPRKEDSKRNFSIKFKSSK